MFVQRAVGKHHLWRWLISGALLLAVVVFLLLRADDFAGTFHLLMRAPLELVVTASALAALTYVAAALSYLALGRAKSLRFWPTLLVQTASGVTNRLLPAGLGAAGLYAIYLRRCGFRYAEATALVAANSILGFVGNTLLLVIGIITLPWSGVSIRLPGLPNIYVVIGGLAAAIVIILVARGGKKGSWRSRWRDFFKDTFIKIRLALQPNSKTLASLLCNLAITTLNALILWVAVTAAGAELYLPLAIAVLTLGALIGAAVPTPGGLGGIEAGILAGLIACGVPAAPALAATLLYRGVTYWLPIVPGLIALPWVRQRYL